MSIDSSLADSSRMIMMPRLSLFLLPAIFKLVSAEVVLDLCSQYWKIYNANKSIEVVGSVPGGVYSALEDTAIIGDILFGKNDIDTRWIGNENWTYFREFKVNSTHLSYPSVQLVLHGVDTLAQVFVNNVHVLSCKNMFLRYYADVKNILQVGTNNITVAFESPIKGGADLAGRLAYPVPPVCHPPSYHGECNINMLRKEQASFAWDWGPAFPSSGLWKPVEVVLSEGPVIRSVGVSTSSEGNYWRLNLTVLFDPTNLKLKDTLFAELSHPQRGLVSVAGKKFNSRKRAVDDKVHMSILVSQDKVDPWWPNGYGAQNLYDLRVYYTYSEKRMQIGFRSLELVQENVSTDEKLGKTFYFRVNGVKMFMKGSNWIPSHALPERLSEPGRVVPLLQAAAGSHFNMLRVWGGGVYESRLFYETCDRLGILVWQDLMFACSMYPATQEFLASVREEVRQQVHRLAHHPSIAIWAGNNENEAALVQNWYNTVGNFSLYKSDYIKLYVETIMPVVKETDPSREFLTSSPSNGLETVQEGYLSTNPQSSFFGDVHYYNYLSNGWDYRIFPSPRFASEYGVQSLPSEHCLRAALPLGQLAWGSPHLEHRQHAIGGSLIISQQISSNLPTSDNLTDIVYLSQINQAMTMKTESEKYRRLKGLLLDSGEGFTMGALYWQLNDIWQAPSWASIDYCGNWKMLQYFTKNFFAPIIVSPELSADGSKISVFVVVDGITKYPQANVTLYVHRWSADGWNPSLNFSSAVAMVENESFIALNVSLGDILKGGKKEDYFISTLLEANGELIAPENFLFFATLTAVRYPETSVKISSNKIISNSSAELTLTAEKLALFVWLDSTGLEGNFSDNGFHMLQPTKTIVFTSKYPLDEFWSQKISVRWLKRTYLS